MASRLSGIPFAFTGRAGDIYPQDGILAEKSRDAIFIRTNNMANKPWLQSFCPAGQKDKVHVIYNGLTLGRRVDCRAPAGHRPLCPHQGLPRAAHGHGPSA